MPEFFRFHPSARLQRFLGRELIADPNLAIIEFVKNAYDAGASEVRIEFIIEGRPKDKQAIRITDNGIGMDRDSFEQDWMNPGYSYKANRDEARGTNTASTHSERRMQERVPTGEKGLGRLAAGRLGDVLVVFTRMRKADPWLHVRFQWKQFSDMNKRLEDVPIPYDFDREPEDAPYDTGTRIVIGELTIDWRGKVPGRKVRGRSDIRLGRLREDLMILTQPLKPVRDDFKIFLETDSKDPELATFTGEVREGALSDLDYSFEFRLEPLRDGVRIERTIRRSPDIARQTGQPTTSTEEQVVSASKPDNDPAAARPTELLCGPFSGVFVYSVTRLSSKRAGEFGVPAGIFLYRDGLRVDPYGHGEDDWLGAYARKAAHQGHAAIQPTQLQGYVEISKEQNPRLIDMSNRQGIVEDEPYENFLAHARAELWRFEQLLLEEFQEERWRESRKERVVLNARSHIDYGIALTRSFIHDLRQPLSALGTAVTQLKYIAEMTGTPDEMKERLRNLHDRSQNYLQDLEAILADAMVASSASPTENVSTFAIGESVAEAIDKVRRYIPTLEVELDLGDGDEVHFPKDTLTRALAVILRNAAEAPRPNDKRGTWAKVLVRRSETGHSIYVSDNGTGIDGSLMNGLFTTTNSTKGRMGVGLMTAQQMLQAFGASCRVEHTGIQGTTFVIDVPSELELPT